MEYYLYILYSEKLDKYYIGYSEDVQKRLEEHNTKAYNTFTSKGRPWELKAVFALQDKQTALKMEKWLKRQKSRRLIENIIQEDFELKENLAQMVRVPKHRD